MKLVKWIAGIAFALIVIVGVGGYIAISSVDLEQVRALVQDQAREATGREVVLAGPIDLAISWTPSIVIEQVTVANAAWGSRPAMVTLERFELQVAVVPLLSGEILVKRLVLVGADVLLEKNADGAVNWSFDGGEPASDASEKAGVVPVIESVSVERSRVTYRDAATGKEIVLAVDRAVLAPAGLNTAVDLEGSYLDVPFAFKGEVGGPAALGGENPFPFRLAGTVAGADIGLDGSIADLAEAPKPTLSFRVAGADLAAFAPLAGTELPKIGPYEVAGSLAGDGSAWTITGLAAKVGGSDLAGDVAVDLGGARPRIDATLTSAMLALADLGGAQAAAEPPSDSPYVIPETPLPLDALKGIDADVILAIAKLVPAQGIEVADVAITLALADGRLVLDPFTATYGGGVASGTLALDAAAEVPALDLDATVADLDFGRVMAEQGISDEVKGTLDIAIALAGRGATPRAIASTLDGTTEVIGENGVISNKILAIVAMGLADVLGPLFGGQDQTTLNCVLSRFDIAGGVATSRSLLLDTSTFSLAGSGVVDLRDESLDLRFDTASRQTALVSLAVPFNVTGTLKNPQVAPDPLGTAAAAAKLAGTAVDPTAVLGALLVTDQAQAAAGNGCVEVERQASEGGGFALPGLEGATETIENAAEGVVEGTGGATEAIEDAVGGAVEGLQNLFGD